MLQLERETRYLRSVRLPVHMAKVTGFHFWVSTLSNGSICTSSQLGVAPSDACSCCLIGIPYELCFLKKQSCTYSPLPAVLDHRPNSIFPAHACLSMPKCNVSESFLALMLSNYEYTSYFISSPWLILDTNSSNCSGVEPYVLASMIKSVADFSKKSNADTYLLSSIILSMNSLQSSKTSSSSILSWSFSLRFALKYLSKSKLPLSTSSS